MAGEAGTGLDLRGLEPPEPLQRALEALAQLPATGRLTIHTDRRPMLLYPKLEERGFRYDTAEAPAGGFLTRIWREEPRAMGREP